MIWGMGQDLCRIERMRSSLEREHFFRRVFGPEEQAYLEGLAEARREWQMFRDSVESLLLKEETSDD